MKQRYYILINDNKEMVYRIGDFVDEILNKYMKKEDTEQQYLSSMRNQASSVYNDLSNATIKESEIEYEKPPKMEKYEPTSWNEDEFPLSNLMKLLKSGKHKTKTRIKIELAETLEYKNVRPKRLATELTIFDLSILRSVHPAELISYNGTPKAEHDCTKLMFFRKRNNMLVNLVTQEISQDYGMTKYFLKVARKLDKIGNYNSLNCVLNALRKQKLNSEDFKKVSKMIERNQDYFEMRNFLDEKQDKKEFYLVPIEIILKDVEDSNRNRDSKIASKRFCRMIEFFVHMQTMKWNLKKKDKYEHFMLSRLIRHESIPIIEVEEEPELEVGAIFLFL